jgi:hypothetical protein
MATPTVQVASIANGFVVTLYTNPNGVPGPTVEQYCADKNAVASYLVAQLTPDATFTPGPAGSY